ncbi:MAG: hypothetical protein J0H34_04310 [Rhizobiales bacterium]|nr:hypothetical protein [Hyphomicrobiales bacterium]
MPTRPAAQGSGAARNARLRGLGSALGLAAGGTVLWSLAAALCAGWSLYAQGWQADDEARQVILVFLAGGALAFAPAFGLARLLSRGKPASAAFAAFFLSLACGTIGLTAALYAFDYRLYYAQWHDAPFTKLWAIQFAFTVAGALYQFALFGLRLYLPFGLAALFAASLWFARLPR